jgi:FtsZ-interacting cell division protein ZipA
MLIYFRKKQMQNIKQKLKIIRKKPIVKQLKNDENGLFSLIFIHFIFYSFVFSLKRKGNSKNKKPTNKSDENTSSSSDNEDEGTNSSDAPVANTEENQPAKEPTPPPTPSSPVQQQQQHEKTDIRKHLRHRKANSSDEEENGTSN